MVKNLSSKWSLKKSFVIYLLIFLILGIALAKITSILIENYEFKSINKYIRSDIIDGREYYTPSKQNLSGFKNYMYKVLFLYKDLAVIIHSILFSLIGFIYIIYINYGSQLIIFVISEKIILMIYLMETMSLYLHVKRLPMR